MKDENKKANPIKKDIKACSKLTKFLIEFTNSHVEDELTEINFSSELKYFNFKYNKIILPIRSNLSPILDMKEANINNFYVSNPVTIKKIEKKWKVMLSKERP